MPIQSVSNSLRMPVIGKIRLGIRKEASSGAQYPSTVEHFVLTDAPEVEKVYGKDPKELDILFPTDNLEQIIPTYYKWYSAGVKGKDGSIIGGKLNCYGNGPDEAGTAGVAHHLAKRDPVTRVPPTRPCLGPKCPDFYAANGQQQCKQSMKVTFMLPMVSWNGVYEIDTTSWHTIRSFHSVLEWVRSLNNGIVKMIPFKIVREEVATNFYDAKSQKEKTGKQYIMFLKDNPNFIEQHGEQMKLKLQSAYKASSNFILPSAQEQIEAPMEDNYAIEGAKVETVSALSASELLLQDAEINAAFDALEAVQNKKYEAKHRLIAIRKYEGAVNQKEEVLARVSSLITSAKTKAAPIDVDPTPAQTAQAAPAAQQAAAPAQDEGIM